MDYEKLFQDAQKQGKVRILGSKRFIFKRKSQKLIGRLLNVITITSEKNKGEFNVYEFDLSDRRVNVVLGAQIDMLYDKEMFIGKGYCIEFRGKVNIGKGQKMNDYIVTEIQMPLPSLKAVQQELNGLSEDNPL
jgi:hypothetical protein